MWVLASSITSTNAWASSLERYSNTTTSSRSEKMDLIRGMRSSVERVSLINRFQVGGFLYAREQSNLGVNSHRNEWETDESRRVCKTSEASERKRGSPFQHRCISFHNPPVTPGCVGRGGRLPCTVANMAIIAEPSANGGAPVNTFIVKKRRLAKPLRAVDHL